MNLRSHTEVNNTNDNTNINTNKRKKVITRANKPDKVSKNNSFSRFPSRDPNNITINSESDFESMDMDVESNTLGGTTPLASGVQGLTQNSNTNRRDNLTQEEVRRIVEPSHNVPTMPNTTIVSSTIPTTSNYLSQSRAPNYIMNPPPIISDEPWRTNRRMSGFPPLEESSTDALLKSLIQKLDLGFSSINANLNSLNTVHPHAQRVAHEPTGTNIVQSNILFPESVNTHPNRYAPTSQAVPEIDMQPSFESNHINRLERIVSDLANQVQALSDRPTNNSAHSISSLPHGSSQNYGGGSSASSYRTWPHKWKIKYDGDNNKLAIEFFLDQVATLKESNDVTWENVICTFPQFLEGEALKWFYRYRGSERDINWGKLKSDMSTQFRGTDTEESLWCKLANRKQSDRETFDKFYNSLLDMQDRVSRKFSDEEMIGILRNNIKFEMKKCLITFATNSLSEFVNKCRLTDKLLYPQLYTENSGYSKRVSEIEAEVEIQPHDIEAFAVKRLQSSGSLNNRQCWNCDGHGHGWQKCVEQRRIFCYYCGYKDVTCHQCPNCLSNFRPPPRTTDPPPANPFRKD